VLYSGNADMVVHNHGPEEGAGLSCNERRLPGGSLLGACMTGRVECGVSKSHFWCLLDPGHSGLCVPRKDHGYEAAQRLSQELGTEVTFTPMERERIHHMGAQPLNGNDAYAVLGTVFDWIEEQETDPSDFSELLDRLRRIGYCVCTTEFGCAACGGRHSKNESPKEE